MYEQFLTEHVLVTLNKVLLSTMSRTEPRMFQSINTLDVAFYKLVFVINVYRKICELVSGSFKMQIWQQRQHAYE